MVSTPLKSDLSKWESSPFKGENKINNETTAHYISASHPQVSFNPNYTLECCCVAAIRISTKPGDPKSQSFQTTWNIHPKKKVLSIGCDSNIFYIEKLLFNQNIPIFIIFQSDCFQVPGWSQPYRGQPKLPGPLAQCTIIIELPQNDHRFASILIPKKMGPISSGWWLN